jgi:putative tryptophan/tyrosine transport system substrate-binding protein
MVFDILYRDCRDLTARPLRDRRARLEDVVAGSEPISRLSTTVLSSRERLRVGSEGAYRKGPVCGRCLRRTFTLALVLLLVGAPTVSLGQSPPRRPFRVGVLHGAFFPIIPPVEGLKAGLKILGREEGRDVVYEIRFTRGKSEGAVTEATELVKSGVDVICAFNEELALAAKRASGTIPIVFMGVGDPVATGLVASISHPGGNVTGVSGMLADLVTKRLETLKALVPGLRRVWTVYHADEVSSRSAARVATETASRLRLDVLDRPVRTSAELVTNLRGVQPGDGLLAPESTSLDIPNIILELQLGNRIPAVFASTFWVQAGGLAAYGADMQPQGVQAARLVDKILRGANPRDLPVEAATKIELAVNVKAARHLGLTIPNEILQRAEQIIQ